MITTSLIQIHSEERPGKLSFDAVIRGSTGSSGLLQQKQEVEAHSKGIPLVSAWGIVAEEHGGNITE